MSRADRYMDACGVATITVSRPLPLVCSDPYDAWTVLVVEVRVEHGRAVSSTLAGHRTPVELLEFEDVRAVESLSPRDESEQYDEDDHYRDDDADEAACERLREARE